MIMKLAFVHIFNSIKVLKLDNLCQDPLNSCNHSSDLMLSYEINVDDIEAFAAEWWHIQLWSSLFHLAKAAKSKQLVTNNRPEFSQFLSIPDSLELDVATETSIKKRFLLLVQIT